MFAKFKYERIPLSLIRLDDRNPRIVTPEKLASEDEIVRYFFEHEDLAGFLRKIAVEGRNQGAERPYVVKQGKEYVVIEGNTRMATYKLLTGQLEAPAEHVAAVPDVAKPVKEDLSSVDCTIAPSRDALLPIMANAHFGLGDKSKWGYLGSRKAVFDEWKLGKTIPQLATAFDRKQGQIRDLLLEYELYLVAAAFDWTPAERQVLLNPAVEFNPPVRFLQTTGHRSAVGIDFDRVNLVLKFEGDEAKPKLHHLVKKLVIDTGKGLGATSTYKDVFADYVAPSEAADDGDGSDHVDAEGGSKSGAFGDGTGVSGGSDGTGQTGTGQLGSGSGDSTGTGGSGAGGQKGEKLAKGALFNYPVSGNSLLLKQLMKEAKGINCNNFPAAGTALLRSLIEAILKSIIDDQGANTQNKLLSLETALDICLGNTVQLGVDDKKILKEFKKNHLDYVNLGAHATVIPNALRTMAARDCIDGFVMRNV